MLTLFSNVPILVEKREKKKEREKGSVSGISTSQLTTAVKRWKGEFTQDIYTEVSFSESKEYGTALREAVAIAKRAKGKKVSFEFQA